MGRAVRSSDRGHEWHYHSQMELTLIVQGSGTHFIGDSITHFNAPDLVLIGPNLPHYWHIAPSVIRLRDPSSTSNPNTRSGSCRKPQNCARSGAMRVAAFI